MSFILKKYGFIQFILLLSVYFLLNQNTVFSQNEKQPESVLEKQQQIYLSVADNMLKDDLIKRAYSYYQDFLELYPESGHTSYVLEKIAIIQEKLYKYEMAASSYKRLQAEIQDEKKRIKYMQKEADIYASMGSYKEALIIYRQIISSDADDETSNSVSEKIKVLNNKINSIN